MKNNKVERKSGKSTLSIMIIISLSYLVLGLIMIIVPDKVGNFLCYSLGSAVTVYGLFNIISFFINKNDEQPNLYFELIIGIISTAFGIFTLITPETIQQIIVAIIGIVIIIDCLMEIKHSIQLKALEMNRWWIFTAISTAIIILSLFMIFNKEFFGELLFTILGIILVYEGISGFVILGFIGHFAKKVTSNRRMIEAEATDID